MTQEGMPLKFQLRNNGKIVGHEEWTPEGWQYKSTDGVCTYLYLYHTDKDQAIGATDSSDPKQELYVGDLIGFNLDKKDVVGLIVWKSFQVWVKIQKHENWATYLGMSHILDFFKIKKLGSRYTKEGKEILEKAGLE